MSSTPAPPLLSLSLCPLSDSVNGSLSICIDPIPIVISMLTSTRSNCWATTQSVRLGCMIASSLIGSQFAFHFHIFIMLHARLSFRSIDLSVLGIHQ